MRALILADSCNPEWPSLPVVGYKAALALGEACEVTLATHVRNRENIEKHGTGNCEVVYIDNEKVAGPMYKLSTIIRGGKKVAWTAGIAMSYLPYLAFEREVWKTLGARIRAGGTTWTATGCWRSSPRPASSRSTWRCPDPWA